MNVKTENGGPDVLDTIKLALAALVAIAGFVAYYWFSESSVLVRLPAVLAGLGLGLAIASQSAQGKQAWEFIKGSQVEIRKVVWPSRQETFNTTMVVLAFTVALGVFFFVVDWGLLKITQFVTGRGG